MENERIESWQNTLALKWWPIICPILLVGILLFLVSGGCTPKTVHMVKQIVSFPRTDGYYISTSAWDIFGERHAYVRLRFSTDKHVLVMMDNNTKKCDAFNGNHSYIVTYDTDSYNLGFNVGKYPYEYDFQGKNEMKDFKLTSFSHSNNSFIVVNFDFVRDEEICLADN